MRKTTWARSVQQQWRRGSRAAWLGAALLAGWLAAVGPAAAQGGGSLRGRVLDATTNAPIVGAQVVLPTLNRGIATGADGRFSLTGLPAGPLRVAVSHAGYSPSTRTVTIPAVGAAEAEFQLNVSAVALDALVVTGTVGQTQRRALGNAVSTVDAAEVVQITEVNNVQQLINGRVAGVVIQPASGTVGSGARIRIRGTSSFSLSNEPLIYVDGVRINNQFATGPANQGFGSSSISRLNDINPEDIESIEIIKGPAAATLYGTEASNGVIQIITKRGSAGEPRWNLTVKQGVNFLRDPDGRFPVNYQIVGADTVALDIVNREDQRGTPIFQNGPLQEYDLTVGGGTERVTYFAGGGYEKSEGIEPTNGVERYSVRLNTTVNATDRLDLAVKLGYIDAVTNLPAEAGFGGRIWTTILADPRKLETRRGFHSGLPEEYDALYHFEQGVNRFTGSIQFNHRPLNWFTHRLNVGTDQTREDNIIFFPRIDSLIGGNFGNEALGYKALTARDIDYRTFDYSATVNTSFGGLESNTSAGAQYYRTGFNFVFAEGSVFPAPGLTAISATTRDRFNAQDFVEEATLGFFVQEQLGWRDRLFLTLALRADDNSAFGRNFDRVYYPKASASWVVTDEPFWQAEFVNTLRLRGAYGEAGQQPSTFAALRTFAPVTGPGDSPAVTPQFIGNPDLGPERSRELELGFDAGFLNDRLGLDFTYYNKRTTDAILDRELAPSVGFPGRQFINAGEVRNSGIELLTRALVLDGRTTNWELSLNVATNDNKVIDIYPEVPDSIDFVGAGSFLRHQVGYPLGSFFERRVVSADLVNGRAVNVLCDDGRGGAISCDRAPLVFLGRSLPDVEGGLTSTLTLWDRLRLYTLLDFKRGQYKVNGNTRVRCTFFGGRCRENFFPDEFDARRIAGVQSNRRLVDFLIEDASFTKLREVALTYMVPEGWVRSFGADRASVTIAGRNLATWTGYSGLEPEAMFLSGSRGGNFGAFEQTIVPQLSQWVASVNLVF